MKPKATEQDLRDAVQAAKELGSLPGWVSEVVWPATWLGALEGRQTVERVLCLDCDGTGYAWDEAYANQHPGEDDCFFPCHCK